VRFGTALTYAAFPDGGGVSRAARSARVSQLALNINMEAHERGRPEDAADDGLEGLGREVCYGALEYHALVGRPDERRL
jgi:hypothetical protein